MREDQVAGDRYILDGEMRVDLVLDLEHGLRGAFFNVFFPYGSAIIGEYDMEVGISDGEVERSWWHGG